MIRVPQRPNLFIVGAPKCGTTSLHGYLAEHPEVFMAGYKEPCFLAPDFRCPAYAEKEEDYLRLFQGHRGQRWLGESTSTYLVSKRAAETIKGYSPGAKIIAMLRNPAEMIHALYGQRLVEGNEDIARFEDALEAEPQRRGGRRLPRKFLYPKEYLLYREFGKYAEQLRRYYAQFARENVHVILFEDFVEDTGREYAKACDFLGVRADFRPEFVRANPAKTPRFRRANRFLQKLPQSVPKPVRSAVKAACGERSIAWLRGGHTQLVSLAHKQGRTPLAEETRRMLIDYFAEDVGELEALLGRDMSGWRLA